MSTKTLRVSSVSPTTSDSGSTLFYALSLPTPANAPEGYIAPQVYSDSIVNPTADDVALFTHNNLVTMTIALAPAASTTTSTATPAAAS